MSHWKRSFLGLMVLASCGLGPAWSQDSATKRAFWDFVAPATESLYCGLSIDFLQDQKVYSVEHIYPKSWMKQTLSCPGSCQIPAYLKFESDMHNLWPAWDRLNSARGNRAFSELSESDDWRGGGCPLRLKGQIVEGPISGVIGVVEPRDEVKGDVARAILYVHQTYGGWLPNGEFELMEKWSIADPVSGKECNREAQIQRLQARKIH